jgi:hypothetical protein
VRTLPACAPARNAGLSTVLQLSYEGIKANLIAEAEKMPEGEYSFKPGQMPTD